MEKTLSLAWDMVIALKGKKAFFIIERKYELTK